MDPNDKILTELKSIHGDMTLGYGITIWLFFMAIVAFGISIDLGRIRILLEKILTEVSK